MENLRDMPKDELEELQGRVYDEMNRRARLASIPRELKDLVEAFKENGGDPSALVEAIGE